jgi:hypothetical protein
MDKKVTNLFKWRSRNSPLGAVCLNQDSQDSRIYRIASASSVLLYNSSIPIQTLKTVLNKE